MLLFFSISSCEPSGTVVSCTEKPTPSLATISRLLSQPLPEACRSVPVVDTTSLTIILIPSSQFIGARLERAPALRVYQSTASGRRRNDARSTSGHRGLHQPSQTGER